MPSTDQKTISDLREDIINELQHEDVTVQIRIAFAVLLQVIGDGTVSDPEGVQGVLLELQHLMRKGQ